MPSAAPGVSYIASPDRLTWAAGHGRIYCTERRSSHAIGIHHERQHPSRQLFRPGDNYWVRFDGEPATRWEDARLFQDNLAELALRGRPTASTQPLRCSTPELTNTGSYEKCWKLENGRWVMHKRGTPGEIFSEAFAAKLGKLLGFPMAEYWAAENCVVTRDFTAGQFNLEPMAYLTGEDEDYGTNYNTLKRLRPGLEHVVRFVIVNYQKFQQKQV